MNREDSRRQQTNIAPQAPAEKNAKVTMYTRLGLGSHFSASLNTYLSTPIPFPVLFRNYVNSFRKSHPASLLRSRLHSSKAWHILHGQIGAYLLQMVLFTHTLL